jgi:hypothetical protein
MKELWSWCYWWWNAEGCAWVALILNVFYLGIIFIALLFNIGNYSATTVSLAFISFLLCITLEIVIDDLFFDEDGITREGFVILAFLLWLVFLGTNLSVSGLFIAKISFNIFAIVFVFVCFILWGVIFIYREKKKDMDELKMKKRRH